MKTIASQLIAAVTLLLAVVIISVMWTRPSHSAGGAVAVQVTNSPLSATDPDNPARQPFGTRVYPSAATVATFTVPAGKRLVIQDVAAFSYGSTMVEDVAVFTTVNGVSTARTIPFTVTNHGIVYADAALNDYADPGTTVTVAIDDTNSNDSAGMNVDIHGYYINLP